MSLAAKWPLLFASYLPAVLTFNLATAIGEEPGWRGYALPRLQERYGPLTASLILGTLHAGWHLPVFLLPAIGLGPLSLSFVIVWLPTIWATTVLWTWVFNNTKGSILIAVLQHSAFDAGGSFVFGPIVALNTFSVAAQNREGIVQMLLFIALAVVVLMLTHGRLSYTPSAGLAPTRPTGSMPARYPPRRATSEIEEGSSWRCARMRGYSATRDGGMPGRAPTMCDGRW